MKICSQPAAVRASCRAWGCRSRVECMAIAFAAVLVALQLATLLDAAGIIRLHQLIQLILLDGVAIWLPIADLRTRLHDRGPPMENRLRE